MTGCTCGQISEYVWAHDDNCPIWSERDDDWMPVWERNYLEKLND
jgi:hypothetical protein